ncbi:dodecin [Thermus filiformis]|uniref:Dodecin flavoprotein n=1 Tax=Thermus filiformis TaxID=276 RepID=A0A0A2WMI8_THEFI|nr:dodecin [Thermus filiformis]KGQ21396.1 dodecin flavoprotein [Thermus filiformis]
MEKVYKKVELVGSSPESIEAAIQEALRRAAKTLRHLDWFEVQEVRGLIGENGVKEYQVVLKVGFRLEE